MHQLRFFRRRKVLFWVIAISGVVTLGLTGILRSLYQQGLPLDAMSVVSLQLAFSGEIFLNILGEWGEAGIAFYRQTLWIDYLYPVAYAFFLSSLMALLTQWVDNIPRRSHTLYVLVPFVAALCDWIENSLHFYMLGDLMRVTETKVQLASAAAGLKWSLVFFGSMAIVYFTAKGVVHFFRQSKQMP